MRWLILMAMVAAGLAPAHAGDPPVLVVDRIAAVVDETPILESTVVARLAIGGDASPGRAAVMNELIEESLVAAEARRLSVTVTPAEVDRAMAAVKHSNGLDDAALAEAVTQQGYTLAGYREAITRQLLKYRLMNFVLLGRTQVADAEIEARYRELGEKRPLAEVREELRQSIYQDKVGVETARWLAALRQAAYVEIR
jgi:parvulin-like peptidyl-prolyl isomerase